MIRGVLIALFASVLHAPAAGGAVLPDSVLVLDAVEVAAERVRFGASTVVTGRDDLHRALATLGIGTLRRGLSLAPDLVFDGFKRADIGVVVDGERYHSACPNRMDPPTSLALPIEITSVTREASACEIGSGLAGRVALERSRPAEAWRARGGMTSMLGSGQDANGTLALEGRRNRLAGRWARGRSYTDGRGRDFGELYGFRTGDVDYSQADVSLRGELGAFAYGVQHSVTRDVPFPYLLMDERDNRLTNVSLSARGQKVYLNRDTHLMDNGLRTSIAMTRMSTDADQTTVGATGRAGPMHYEGFFRRWKVDNVIAMGASRLANAMIPDVKQGSVEASGTRAFGTVTVSVRAGWSRVAIGDRDALTHHLLLEPGAHNARTFFPFAISAGGYWPERQGLRPGFTVEAASEAPTLEQLYITVQRPGAPATRKPDWVGNPTLDPTLRVTARASVRHRLGIIEGHLSHLSGYVLPVAARAGDVRFLTYRGIEAAIAAIDLRVTTGPAELLARWASGQNLDSGGPLPEMPPLQGSLTLRSPPMRGAHAFARVSGATRARRVDVTLGETPTPAWASLDLGARWEESPGLTVELEVDNVTDALYTRHLSYLRDPFAAGLRVWEPGRMVRMMVTFDR